MHVVAIAIGVILSASFFLRIALNRFLHRDDVARAKRRNSFFPGLNRIPYISRPLRVVWACVDFANFLILLAYAILLGWTALLGPIRPVHEWFR